MSGQIMLRIFTFLMVCLMHTFIGLCLEVEVSSKAVSCNGGSDGQITINISENSFIYSLRLMEAINNKLLQTADFDVDTTIAFTKLKPGEYIIQVFSNGNSLEQSIHVKEPDKLEADFIEIIRINDSGTQILADLKLNYSGGTPPYTIIWEGNNNLYKGEIVKNLSLGIYTCQLKDSANCKSLPTTFFLFDDEIQKFKLKNNSK